ncbi:ABC transporter permease [Hymenobacter sp. AT01-02]|uniref:ABC transporter permease n=1 Tax=Hymenobacter sp. AT01-02 TaxID=1571877 RepID=UPI000A702FF2|nr:ABC transporter permease [Hymenobacter sp. AT01-02]
MDKIWLIAQREYLTRVRKKSFIIMSLIGPLLTVALFAVPILIASLSDKDKTVAVADAGNLFSQQLPEAKEDLRFVRVSPELAKAKQEFKAGKYEALVYIPKLDLANPTGFQVFSRKSKCNPGKRYQPRYQPRGGKPAPGPIGYCPRHPGPPQGRRGPANCQPQ